MSVPTTITRTPIGASLSASVLPVSPGTTNPATVTVNVARPSGDTDVVTIVVVNAPNGVQTQISQPGTGNSGAISFTTMASAPGGSFAVTIQTADSATSVSNTLTLILPVVVTVSASPDTSAGVNGDAILSQFMSTSFQPASWTANTFNTAGSAKEAELNVLGSPHIRLQPVEQGTPETAPGTWKFATLNALLDPVMQTADGNPELQLARAPEYLYSGTTLPASAFAQYAQYAANMLRYYNTRAGFTDGDAVVHSHVLDSPSVGFTPITYWGIYNEPNYNGVSASDYVTLYNMTVAAMKAVVTDPDAPPIQFVAVEMGDGFSSGQQAYFAAFPQGVNQEVDVIATHYYATCNQADTDQTLFDAIPNTFVQELKFIQSTMKGTPLEHVPIWITENNVNADYDQGGGISACNGGAFTTDQRGTSAYFAAWRPYMFSQVGKLGIDALYQWTFDGDQQYGEVDDNANKYLSFWVDFYLREEFPFIPDNRIAAGEGEKMLRSSTNEPGGSQSVEVLAAQRADGTCVILLSDHAVANALDNNGSGSPRTMVLDVSALGSFSYADLVILDASTNTVNGPTPHALTPASQITVNLGGYGTAFVTFSNSAIPHSTPTQPKPRAINVPGLSPDCDDSDDCYN